MAATRKPLARVPALAKFGERRDVRRTFRFTEAEDAALQAGAVGHREEFSEYCRRCLLTGHSIRQAERLMERTRA